MFRGFARLHKGQAKSVMRQAMQLSHAFDTGISGTRVVDESEAWAYLSIGIGCLLLALLLWFVPQIVSSRMLILVVGGLSAALHAIQAACRIPSGANHNTVQTQYTTAQL